MHSITCVILGGGQGTRLYPLTQHRSKPAVPVAGRYRLIDIPISNCLNSGLRRIYVLTQFNSESLNRHISTTYNFDVFSGGFVQIIAAEQTIDNTNWFQGTADAVRQCLWHMVDPRIEYVVILSGDHLYTLNIMDLVNWHKQHNAQITVSCKVVDKNESYRFGIMGVDANGWIEEFIEKPSVESIPEKYISDNSGTQTVLASMGIYVFNAKILSKALSESSHTDFGKGIIPESVGKYRVSAFKFDRYWEDIGTIGSFYKANLTLVDPNPPLNLYSEEWPMFTHMRHLPPVKVNDSRIHRVMLAPGSYVDNAEISRSIIGVRSSIKGNTKIENSIIMGYDYYTLSDEIPMGIAENCYIKNAIIDKNVRIGAGSQIINKHGRNDVDTDEYAIRDGIVVVKKSTVLKEGTVI
jgi:glucose-1-phosphate adenylyltransferase